MEILLADDHTLVRDGLRPFLEELSDDVTVIEAETFESALRAAHDAHDLKLILIDLAMPGMNDLAGVRKMMETHPQIPLVILSGTHDQKMILKAFDFGIAGFIPKSTGSEIMLNALQLVMAGERYIPSQILIGAAIGDALTKPSPAGNDPYGISISHLTRFENLSKREKHVLELLVGGMTNKGIARSIDLQEATIKIHVKNIYRKIGASNRAQAVRMAIQPGWQVTPSRRPSS
ncbi:MAG: response regulator transcription factor [Magnetovibrio sp.]|nr:response regulator transcription factor [Magnetovibrio sp.]